MENEMISLYLSGLSARKICSKFNIGYVRLSRILRLNGVEMRGPSESIKLYYENNPRKHSEETKKLLSTIRKEWLKDNPDKHPWKSKEKFVSEPCENLKRILSESGIVFIEEYQPLQDRFYSIDIVLLNQKIGIEVNGNQHYNRNGELKKYYQERHDNITNDGWYLYEIHYSKCYDDIFIGNLIDSINNKILLEGDELKFIMFEKSPNFCECGSVIRKESTNCRSCSSIKNSIKRRKVDRPKYDILLKDIELSNYSSVGRKYGVSDTTIRNWVKFYEKN